MPDPLKVPLILGVPELVAVTEEVPEPVDVSEGVPEPLNVPLTLGVSELVAVTAGVPDLLTV